jgi:hypothetical protein
MTWPKNAATLPLRSGEKVGMRGFDLFKYSQPSSPLTLTSPRGGEGE